MDEYGNVINVAVTPYVSFHLSDLYLLKKNEKVNNLIILTPEK
jgi:hypothetical protein